MTEDILKALNDGELVQFITQAQREQRARANKHKQETIGRIRRLARSIEVGIKIEGTRGRHRKMQPTSTNKGSAEVRALSFTDKTLTQIRSSSEK